MGYATAEFFGPAPPWAQGGGGGGQKVKNHKISNTKSISMIFIPNFVCVHINERYNTYQTKFVFYHLGHASGVQIFF